MKEQGKRAWCERCGEHVWAVWRLDRKAWVHGWVCPRCLSFADLEPIDDGKEKTDP